MITTFAQATALYASRCDLDHAVDPLALFTRLTAGGRQTGSMLLESGEQAPTYAERSIAVVRPSLVVSGKGRQFGVRALDDRGRRWLSCCAATIAARAVVTLRTDDQLAGVVESDPRQQHRPQGQRSTAHLDVLRALLPESPVSQAADVPVGLYGCFAYDFVRQLEDVPAAATDVLGEPDYELFLSTRLCVIDHLRQRTTLVSLVPGDDRSLRAEARADVEDMRRAARNVQPVQPGPARVGPFTSDTSRAEFCDAVRTIQGAIHDGRAFQVVYGRTLQASFSGDPLAAYSALKRLNPSPYMFYMRDSRGVLLGASPELAVRVAHVSGTRQVEIKPIAGTAPRGRIADRIDRDVDARMEAALRTDAKELAEHAMLVDLARNDVASIAEPGTTELADAFMIEKFSHVQHLVSRVTGVLRHDLDALDAYAATMNMGTLTGAPKPEAMKLIAELEHSARGFFGGGVGFVTAGGELETAIVIRAVRILGQQAYIRAGAGIVADSVPEREWDETSRKAQGCIQALREAGHVRS